MDEQQKNVLDAQYVSDIARIKESLSRIKEYGEINFLEGYEEEIGYFPIFDNDPELLVRFSYGLKAPNMSSVYFDKERESEVTVERNERFFLENQGFDSENTIQALGKFQGQEAQIEEVSFETLSDKKKSVGNVVFTRDPRITLKIKPADCPTGIFYCKDQNGNPVTGIIHGGAESANYGLIRQGLQALQIQLGVDLKTLKIGVFPGMKDYTMSKFQSLNGEIKRRYQGFYPINLSEYLEEPKTDDPTELRKVDLISVFEMQSLQAGVMPENMEVYRVDTYADAARGRAFSRRYSNDHNGEHPGSNMIAVRLNV